MFVAVSFLIMGGCYYKKKTSKNLSLMKQEHSPTIAGTPEKYSRKENDRATLVAHSSEGNDSSHIVRRSTISIASLSNCSNEPGETLTPAFKLLSNDCSSPSKNGTTPYNNDLPIGSTMNVLRQNSPIENNQSLGFWPSNYTSPGVDTGYNSNATSRKPSLVGSRASSTSLRHPSSATMATGGNVYPTGQHQLYPHHRTSHQRSKGSLTSFQTNTSLGRAVGKGEKGLQLTTGKSDDNFEQATGKGENIF